MTAAADVELDELTLILRRSRAPNLNVCCPRCDVAAMGVSTYEFRRGQPDEAIFHCVEHEVRGRLLFDVVPGRAAPAIMKEGVVVLPCRGPRLRARCPCGREGGVAVSKADSRRELWLTCVVLGCGHGFKLEIDYAIDFCFNDVDD